MIKTLLIISFLFLNQNFQIDRNTHKVIVCKVFLGICDDKMSLRIYDINQKDSILLTTWKQNRVNILPDSGEMFTIFGNYLLVNKRHSYEILSIK